MDKPPLKCPVMLAGGKPTNPPSDTASFEIFVASLPLACIPPSVTHMNKSKRHAGICASQCLAMLMAQIAALPQGSQLLSWDVGCQEM